MLFQILGAPVRFEVLEYVLLQDLFWTLPSPQRSLAAQMMTGLVEEEEGRSVVHYFMKHTIIPCTICEFAREKRSRVEKMMDEKLGYFS